MDDFVVMRHPDLGTEHAFHRDAVPLMATRGWQVGSAADDQEIEADLERDRALNDSAE